MAEQPHEPSEKADEQAPKMDRPSERKPEPEPSEPLVDDIEVEDRFQSTDN
jgi:hypothetical protein